MPAEEPAAALPELEAGGGVLRDAVPTTGSAASVPPAEGVSRRARKLGDRAARHIVEQLAGAAGSGVDLPEIAFRTSVVIRLGDL